MQHTRSGGFQPPKLKTDPAIHRRLEATATKTRRRGARLPHRQGSTLAAAIVALAVASTVLFYMLKNTLDQQRQMLTHRQEVQADWLATAGIDRAIAQLQNSPSYTGETWRVPAEELNNTDAAEVTITVERSGESNQREITVQADCPADTIHRSRRTKQTIVPQR